MNNSYQLTLLIKQDLAEADRKEFLESVTKKLGKIVKEDLWGQRDLSYPIKHQTKAYYAHFEFEDEPKSISPLDKMLKLNEDVLRYLIIKTNK